MARASSAGRRYGFSIASSFTMPGAGATGYAVSPSTSSRTSSFGPLLIDAGGVSTALVFHAQLGAARVRFETLGARERGGDGAEEARAFARDADHARALLEVVDTQGRREARRARGGQHMVGTGAVIAQRLGGVVAEEDRAGVADAAEERLRIGDRQLEVLGRDAVGDLARGSG